MKKNKLFIFLLFTICLLSIIPLKIAKPVYAQTSYTRQEKTNEVSYVYDCIKAEILIKDEESDSFKSMQNINAKIEEIKNNFENSEIDIIVLDYFHINNKGFSNVIITISCTNCFEELKTYLEDNKILVKNMCYSLKNYDEKLQNAVKQTKDLLNNDILEENPNRELVSYNNIFIETIENKDEITFIIKLSAIYKYDD